MKHSSKFPISVTYSIKECRTFSKAVRKINNLFANLLLFLMMANVKGEKTLKPKGYICECYKKLDQYKQYNGKGEDEFYGESDTAIAYESTFELPGPLIVNDEITEYLRVDNDMPAVFRQMAEVFPTLSDFEENILSFWILDVIIEGLWAAQNAKMSFKHQKATLLWIAYFFNYIQKENPTRKQLFYHLKVTLFQTYTAVCGESVSKEHLEEPGYEPYSKIRKPENIKSTHEKLADHFSLPLPPALYRKPQSEGSSSMDSADGSSTTDSEIEGERENERNVSDMKVIVEILYRIFARIYVYLQIQTVLNIMPPLELVMLPFSLRTPKPLFKPDAAIQIKTEKGGKKGSVVERSIDVIESEKELTKHDYILPLEAAEEAKEYMKHPSSDRSLLWRSKEEKNKK